MPELPLIPVEEARRHLCSSPFVMAVDFHDTDNDPRPIRPFRWTVYYTSGNGVCCNTDEGLISLAKEYGFVTPKGDEEGA